MRRVFCLFAVACLAMITSCKSDFQETVIDESLAQYISVVTTGEIGCDDEVLIRFNNRNSSDLLVGLDIEEPIFKFTPQIKGRTYWKDPYTVAFKSEKSLKYGKTYQGTINLSNLHLDFLPDSIKQFLFVVRIPEMAVVKCENQLDLINSNDPKFYRYRADITFSASANEKLFEEGITLEANGKKIGTKITGKDRRTITLESESIERTNDSQKIVLKVDKSTFNMTQHFVSEMELSPLNQMKILSISQDLQGKNPRIRVEFSDELSSKQDLNGLVSISPAQELKLYKMGSRLLIDGKFAFGSTYTLTLNAGLQSRWATKTTSTVTEKISFPDVVPQIEFVSDGVFLPSSNDFRVQFYSCNLSKVHIELKKVYDSGIHEFLSTEQLSSLKDRHSAFNGTYNNRVGVILHNETFDIGNTKNEWLLNEIDLTKVIKKHGKGLYLIQLNFNPADMLTTIDGDLYPFIEDKGQIYKPIICTNIGLTCKKSEDGYWVYATDLTTARPISNVNLEITRDYNFSEAIRGVTNSEGVAKLTIPYNDYYYGFSQILAEKNGERSAIRLEEMEWNTSGFDVGGADASSDGVRAYAYTERGVYRPGDLINLSIIARGISNLSAPMTVELCNPQSKVVYSQTCRDVNDGFYSFAFQTDVSDMTGKWYAQFYAGSRYFYHEISIETVVANTMKATITTDKSSLEKDDTSVKIDLDAKYLFGAPASGNLASLSAEILSFTKSFDQYKGYTFSNPSIDFYAVDQPIVRKNLDEAGKLSIVYEMPKLEYAPSGLIMKINAKIFENEGRSNDFSKHIEVNPVRYYVGIREVNSMLKSGSDMNIPVVLVDTKGTLLTNRTLKYRIYRNEETWWWQYDSNRKLRFKTDINTMQVAEGEVASNSNIRFNPNENGSYFIEVIDEKGDGHSSGFFFDVDRYGGQLTDNSTAGTLALESNREKYVPGQTMSIEFQGVDNGRALVSVEKGNRILFSKWINTTSSHGPAHIEIPVTSDMVPNVYVTVSLIQPQNQTSNDRPIRMIGILPVSVVEPSSAFGMNITTSNSFRSGEPFEVSLQTTNHKPCQFTIAVVDEGLLDLTAFETPSPWDYFYQKIGLGVKSYDLYSQVITPNLDDVFRTFSIGGGLEYLRSQLNPNESTQRFQSVSLFKGPISTDTNGAAKVQFRMPNYVGSVKIMVVAANEDSYANAEKEVAVKKELMLLPSLPRVLGPDETVQIPVSVFAMEKGMGNVSVSLQTTGPVEVVGNAKQTVTFTDVADKECYFTVKAKKEIGVSKITLVAESSKYKTNYSVDLSVRPSSTRIYESETKTIDQKQTVVLKVPQNGVTGSNLVQLNLSILPGMDFGHRLDWLINYPYGCLEQTVSAVMPQLRLSKFIDYPEAKAKEIDEHINIAIERLRRFQTYNGSFSYWPGNTDVSEWASLYAAHFLVEAKSLGYYVPTDMFDNAIMYLTNGAESNKGIYNERAYRVFILSLAGRPVTSEMNLLDESKAASGDQISIWHLAASFYLNGQKSKALDLVSSADKKVNNYAEFSSSFGSGLRDQAIILEALVIMNKTEEATEMAKEVSAQLATRDWYSTQSLGYAVNAMGKFAEQKIGENGSLRIKGQLVLPDGKNLAFDTKKNCSFDLSNYSGKEIRLEFDQASSFDQIFAVFNYSGFPLKDQSVAESKNLSLKVEWYGEDGSPIDPSNLKQGTSFWGYFSVKNLTDLEQIEEVALVCVLPSGWEIQNTRLNSELLPHRFDNLKLGYEEFQEIRDDRVMWFFDINKWAPLNGELDFVVKLNAVNKGSFYMPGIIVEAMYNNGFRASTAGFDVNVE